MLLLRGLLVLFFLIVTAQAGFADTRVKDVRLGLQEGGGTRFVMETDGALDYHLFLLNNPPRAVVDLPPLKWNDKLLPASKGLVKGWRRGQFGQGTRVVLDLSGGATVEAVRLLPPAQTGAGQIGAGMRFVLDLKPVDSAAFIGLMGKTWGKRTQDKTHLVPAVAVIPPRQPLDLKKQFEQHSKPPMVVIDAGHGGVDPGATGANHRREKDLTLSVALQLAQALRETKLYRVHLTRSHDTFVPLRERVAIARRKKADLFISLHADSLESENDEVKGATIYTLSDRATDNEAAELAESENRADLLAGLEQAGNDDGLATILADMSYRACVNSGHDFSALLAQEMGKKMRLSPRPQRSAGFAVLKSPDVPSVLIEMGYLSSPSEAKLLFERNHQRNLVQAITRATNRFFMAQDSTFEARAILQ